MSSFFDYFRIVDTCPHGCILSKTNERAGDGRAFVWGDRQWMVPYEISSSLVGGERVVDVAACPNLSAVITGWNAKASCTFSYPFNVFLQRMVIL